MITDHRSPTRRGVLAGVLAGAGLAAVAPLVPRDAVAATLPPAMQLPFEVRRGDSPIGSHRLTFTRDGDRTTVEIAIDMEVKFTFVPVYRYVHRNTEVWQGDRLVSLDTRTDDNGDSFTVSARRTAEGIEVEGAEGRVLAPADILPTSYWRGDTINQTRLLDTQRGVIRQVAFSRAGREQVVAAGTMVPAARWRMTGDLTADVWYSDLGQWVKLAFEVRGASIAYTLAPGSAGRDTLARNG